MTSIAHPLTQADWLQQQLARMRENGEQNFDPLRFHFLESLWQRSSKQRENVQRILQDKLQLALNAYITECEQSRARAEQQLQMLAAHPKIGQLQELFQGCDYNAVIRQAESLANEATEHTVRALASLTEQLANMKLTKAHQKDTSPFDNPLLQQDQATIATLTGAGDQSDFPPRQAPRGLAAGRHLQTLVRQHHEATLISEALLHAPQDPGPLNAHKLLLSALSSMRELSPKYVSRFATYGENLLWLEAMGRRESASTKTKTKS